MERSLTILMTGTTGFLGQYALRNILTHGHRVIAVLRPPLPDSRSRLTGMFRKIGADPECAISEGRLVLVEGSLPDQLPESTWGRTDLLLHCAASLQLYSNGNGDPFATNTLGTRALLQWADAHGVDSLHAVSTAYTCGWNRGLIREQFHDPEPEFQTDYEKSKWTAELALREWGSQPGHRLTLYRPSFIVGDSSTGYTTQFAGFYQFARLVGLLKQQYFDPNNGKCTHVPLRIPGGPDAVQNIVPVDFVADMIAAIVDRPQYHGRIYHLTNPSPPNNELLKRCYEEHFGLDGGYFAEPDEVVGHYTEAESLLWDRFQILAPRLNHNPLFDVRHTREVMAETGIEFPVFDRETLLTLLQYAETSNWGRNGNGHA